MKKLFATLLSLTAAATLHAQTSPPDLVVHDLTATGTITGNGSGLSNVPLATPAKVYVSPAGVDPTQSNPNPANVGLRGREDRPFAGLQAAWDAAVSGDTIEIAPATYQIPFPVGSAGVGLTFAGKKIIIHGNGATFQSTTDDGERVGVFLAGADGTEMHDLTFDARWTNSAPGLNAAIEFYEGVKDIHFDHVSIINERSAAWRFPGHGSGSTIRNCSTEHVALSVAVAENYDSPVVELDISHNHFRKGTSSGIGGGIRFSRSPSESTGNIDLKGTSICDNRIDDAGQMGVEMWSGTNYSFEHYTIDRNYIHGVAFGISTAVASMAEVSDNIVIGSSYIGIEAAVNADHLLVLGNLVDSYDPEANITYPSAGITSTNTASHHVMIAYNHVLNCYTSIGLQNVDGADVSHNWLAGFSTHGIVLQETNRVNVTDNYFEGASGSVNCIEMGCTYNSEPTSESEGHYVVNNTVAPGGGYSDFILIYNGQSATTANPPKAINNFNYGGNRIGEGTTFTYGLVALGGDPSRIHVKNLDLDPAALPATVTGIRKSAGAGGTDTAAMAGTDYVSPAGLATALDGKTVFNSPTTFNSQMNLPGVYTNYFTQGAGDNATQSAYNLKWHLHWGLGIENLYNQTSIWLDARSGNISTVGNVKTSTLSVADDVSLAQSSLTMQTGGYGAQFLGYLQGGVGGMLRLAVLDNNTSTDGLSINRNTGSYQVHTVMPLAIDAKTTVGTNGVSISSIRHGTVSLASGGTVNVNDPGVTANTRIVLTAQDNNTLGALRVSARTAGTGFTIKSSNTADSGTVAYEEIEP